LDHDWFDHRSLFKRATLQWPDGKPVALWITVPVEFFPLEAPAEPFRPIGGLALGYPDTWNFSSRDYGTRIGIYRIMQVLDRLGLRATAAVNSAVADRHPRIVDELTARRWEIMANGVDMGHLHHGKLEVDEERKLIQSCRETLASASGGPIAGWLSPGRSQSAHTLALLAESGFRYVTDWANDDLPYAVRTASGALVAMPLTHEWADRVLLVHHNLTVDDYQALVLQAFERLRAEAMDQGCGRILSLSVTPWIMGYPHRIGTLERTLGTILQTGVVWRATGGDIVAAFHAQAGATAKR
jgi:peptidoglycan/xylan/chitin deacetylase (PgdA/CDA1 family)